MNLMICPKTKLAATCGKIACDEDCHIGYPTIKCEFYQNGGCHDPDMENFEESYCATCEFNKDQYGIRYQFPKCVLLCDCEEEACNKGEIIENQ